MLDKRGTTYGTVQSWHTGQYTDQGCREHQHGTLRAYFISVLCVLDLCFLWPGEGEASSKQCKGTGFRCFRFKSGSGQGRSWIWHSISISSLSLGHLFSDVIYVF